jgi:excinuclease ABC subunit C
VLIRCEEHTRVIDAIRKNVPPSTGVYRFFDGNKKVLYIGKSVNLRRRMLSYFRHEYDAVDPAIGRMILSIRDFDYVVTETELQALLLEDELIKERLPEYNTRQKSYEEYRYVLLSDDPFPALKMVSSRDESEGGVYFGPYRDRYFVDDLLNVIQKHLHLRVCTDPVPHRKDSHFSIGRCKGPCRQGISVENYALIARDVIDFLNGDGSLVIDRIEREMEAAAARMSFEKAAALKDRIEFCRRFCVRQRFINKFKTQKLTVLERGRKEITHVFVKGWLETRPDLTSNGARAAPVTGHRDGEGDARFILDRANIVFSWIQKNETNCEYHFE